MDPEPLRQSGLEHRVMSDALPILQGPSTGTSVRTRGQWDQHIATKAAKHTHLADPTEADDVRTVFCDGR